MQTTLKTPTGHHCPLELVIEGAFADARYFSITVNDEHNAAAQHLVDAAIDPVASESTSGTTIYTYTNPFVVPSGGSSQPYSSGQAYLVPISLGRVSRAAPSGQRTGLGHEPGVPD
jgi:hypothetical protein